MWATTIASLVALALCGVWVWTKLRWYAHADTPRAYLLLVGFVWWMGVAAVTVLLPLDVTRALHSSPPPDSEAAPASEDRPIITLWQINYWTTFVCCWVVCPLAMEYWASGEFRPKDRLRSAVLKNARFYLAALAVLGVVAASVALSEGFHIAKVSGFLIAAANMYGMLLVVVMLGYGVVEVPRELWYKTTPRRVLEWHYCGAPLLETRMLDAQADLADVLARVDAFRCPQDLMVQLNYDVVRTKARAARETCLEEGGGLGGLGGASGVRRSRREAANGATSGSGGSGGDGDGDGDGEAGGDIKALAKLHYQLKKCVVQAERSKYEWDHMLEATEALEREVEVLEAGSELYQPLDDSGGARADVQADADADAGLGLGLGLGVGVGVGAGAGSGSGSGSGPPRRLVLYYNALKVCAALLMVVSVIVLWNESVAAVQSRLSVFALVVRRASGELALWLWAALPLMYMATCVYVALFKFRLLDALAMHGNRQTDAYCLLFNATYMGRLQFSLGVNYVNQLHPDDVARLGFHALTGDMGSVPFFGGSFNSYLPVLILVLAACTLVRVLDRILNLVGIETHSEPGNSQESKELQAQGRAIVHRNRARMQRRRNRRSNMEAGTLDRL